MKKSLKNIILSLLLASFAVAFVSCGYEPVFYGIMHDVLPEEATVSGNITSIARCTISGKEYLVLSSGGSIMYKEAASSQHGDWKSENIKLPFTLHHYNYFSTSSEPEGHVGQQILRVIADKDNLYLLTSSFQQDNEYGVVLPDAFHLWTVPLASFLGGSKDNWTDLVKGNESLFPSRMNSSQSQVEMGFSFFFTNTPIPANRKAFLSVTDSNTNSVAYYLLNGGSAPQDCTSTVTGSNFIKTNKDNTRANSAFYIGSSLYFSDSFVITTNETATTPATCVCMAGVSGNYYPTSDLFYYDGTGSLEKVLTNGASSPVSALAFTADSILIGEGSYSSTYTSNGGIERVLLGTDGKPENTTAEFENNAKYQFTSGYILLTLLCADPSKKEAEASIYATISYRGSGSSASASFNDIGLWSYYPSRGNWNRE